MASMEAEHQVSGWTPDDSTFGARLALVRQRMGWGNVKEAAVACGVPVESWRSWERDGRSPRNVVDIAANIAERTGCNYAWLVDPRLAGREGRVLTTVGSTAPEQGRRTKFSQSPLTSRPRPNGHPKRAQPHPSLRRPGRLRAAHA